MFGGRRSKNGKEKEDDDENVDAKLAELTTAATALADSSDGPGKGRRRGEILAGRGSRPRQSGYGSAGTTDGDWESVGSDSQSSLLSCFAVLSLPATYATLHTLHRSHRNAAILSQSLRLYRSDRTFQASLAPPTYPAPGG